MGYIYSDIDNRNIKWFKNDKTRSSLKSINLIAGQIRSLNNAKIEFNYPITAIAGQNGVGKSTILHLAACAYKGHKFRDTFIQIRDEQGLKDLEVEYEITTNTSRPTRYALIKRSGDRSFKNYKSQVDRTVEFIGISRIIPLSEDNKAKRFRYNNRDGDKDLPWSKEVTKSAEKILRKKYKKVFQRDTLFVIDTGNAIYSLFNSGAGEGSVFDILLRLYESEENTLFLVEEIELGLHDESQRVLIDELKSICYERKCHIICTTHSPQVLDALPPEGRVFLERADDTTVVLGGISSGYAIGKFSGQPNSEVDILVEDEIAKSIVENCLATNLRTRVKILPIGSSRAVMMHLAARYREKKYRTQEVCVILDGDKKSEKGKCLNLFLNALEKSSDNETAKEWAEKRLSFLPGEKWPEHWIITQTSNSFYNDLATSFKISNSDVTNILIAGNNAGKHNEFHEIAKQLNLGREAVVLSFVNASLRANPGENKSIIEFIQKFLT